MPNLRGASPIGRDDGGLSYAAQAGGKGDSRFGDVDGVWRDGVIRSRKGVASASRSRTGGAGRSDRCLKGVRSGISNQGGCGQPPRSVVPLAGRREPGWPLGLT